MWIKKADYENRNYIVNASALAKNKEEKIVKLTPDGAYIETDYYKDIKTNHKIRIIECCNGLRKSALGYKWQRYDDYCQHANTEVN